MAESAEQKATREAAERQAELDKAVADAVAARDAAHAEELEAERTASAARIAELTGNPSDKPAKAKRGETKLYVLKSDVMHQHQEDGTYVTYSRGDKVPLTYSRARELIASGDVVDPDAKDDGVKPGSQTVAPGE